MNLQNIKFENLENESFPFRDYTGRNAKHLQYWTIYRGVKIYKREIWIEGFDKYSFYSATYSVDKIRWFETLVEIQGILKKMGK